jgi:hypothetical protein
VEAAQVARRSCGVAGDGALSEWMAGVGALMVVAGCASAWALGFPQRNFVLTRASISEGSFFEAAGLNSSYEAQGVLLIYAFIMLWRTVKKKKN